MRLIETGRWLGLVPASVMRFGGKHMSIKVLPVKVLSPPAPIGFIAVKDRMLTPLAERFIACAQCRQIGYRRTQGEGIGTVVPAKAGPMNTKR
jgi:hypothetical protein